MGLGQGGAVVHRAAEDRGDREGEEESGGKVGGGEEDPGEKELQLVA